MLRGMNQRIAAAMIAKGFDQLGLARALNVSASTVSRWLKPDADLSLDTLRRVAEVTDARVEALLYRPARHLQLTRSPVTAEQGNTRFMPTFLHAALEASQVRAMLKVHPLERFELPIDTLGLPRGPATAFGWTLGHWDEPTDPAFPEEQSRGTLLWLAMLDSHGDGTPEPTEWSERRSCGLNTLYRHETRPQPGKAPEEQNTGVTSYLSSTAPGDWRWPKHLSAAGLHARTLTPDLRLSGVSRSEALLLQNDARGDYLCLRADIGDTLRLGMEFYDMLERRSHGAVWVKSVPPGGWPQHLKPLLTEHGGLDLTWLRALITSAPPDARICLLYAGQVLKEQYSGWWGQKRQSEEPLYLPLWGDGPLLQGLPQREVTFDGRVEPEAFTPHFVERLANGGPGWAFTLPRAEVPRPLLWLDGTAGQLASQLDVAAALVKLSTKENPNV